MTDDGPAYRPPPGGRRVRAAELGLSPGTLPSGPLDAITDVPGIRVGHVTLAEGDSIRTGVTAIVHDVLLRRVPDGPAALAAGLAVANGFGKLTGSTQVDELGTLETPVLLTGTLSVFRVADGLLSYLHGLPGFAGTRTLNPVVGETNDGLLSDIWARPVTADHVAQAIETATAGPVAEGCVGAGTGTAALGYKAGIGTASRAAVLTDGATATVGALVQANFGGVLTVRGVELPPPDGPRGSTSSAGSCVIVLATDAPLDTHELRRLSRRAFAGMARTGADFSGQSGDYALAVSTADLRNAGLAHQRVPVRDRDVLFKAAAEATEEAILNSLFMAVDTTGYRGQAMAAVPLDYLAEQVTGRSASRGG